MQNFYKKLMAAVIALFFCSSISLFGPIFKSIDDFPGMRDFFAHFNVKFEAGKYLLESDINVLQDMIDATRPLRQHACPSITPVGALVLSNTYSPEIQDTIRKIAIRVKDHIIDITPVGRLPNLSKGLIEATTYRRENVRAPLSPEESAAERARQRREMWAGVDGHSYNPAPGMHHPAAPNTQGIEPSRPHTHRAPSDQDAFFARSHAPVTTTAGRTTYQTTGQPLARRPLRESTPVIETLDDLDDAELDTLEHTELIEPVPAAKKPTTIPPPTVRASDSVVPAATSVHREISSSFQHQRAGQPAKALHDPSLIPATFLRTESHAPVTAEMMATAKNRRPEDRFKTVAPWRAGGVRSSSPSPEAEDAERLYEDARIAELEAILERKKMLSGGPKSSVPPSGPAPQRLVAEAKMRSEDEDPDLDVALDGPAMTITKHHNPRGTPLTVPSRHHAASAHGKDLPHMPQETILHAQRSSRPATAHASSHIEHTLEMAATPPLLSPIPPVERKKPSRHKRRAHKPRVTATETPTAANLSPDARSIDAETVSATSTGPVVSSSPKTRPAQKALPIALPVSRDASPAPHKDASVPEELSLTATKPSRAPARSLSNVPLLRQAPPVVTSAPPSPRHEAVLEAEDSMLVPTASASLGTSMVPAPTPATIKPPLHATPPPPKVSASSSRKPKFVAPSVVATRETISLAPAAIASHASEPSRENSSSWAIIPYFAPLRAAGHSSLAPHKSSRSSSSDESKKPLPQPAVATPAPAPAPTHVLASLLRAQPHRPPAGFPLVREPDDSTIRHEILRRIIATQHRGSDDSLALALPDAHLRPMPPTSAQESLTNSRTMLAELAAKLESAPSTGSASVSAASKAGRKERITRVPKLEISTGPTDYPLSGQAPRPSTPRPSSSILTSRSRTQAGLLSPVGEDAAEDTDAFDLAITDNYLPLEGTALPTAARRQRRGAIVKPETSRATPKPLPKRVHFEDDVVDSTRATLNENPELSSAVKIQAIARAKLAKNRVNRLKDTRRTPTFATVSAHDGPLHAVSTAASDVASIAQALRDPLQLQLVVSNTAANVDRYPPEIQQEMIAILKHIVWIHNKRNSMSPEKLSAPYSRLSISWNEYFEQELSRCAAAYAKLFDTLEAPSSPAKITDQAQEKYVVPTSLDGLADRFHEILHASELQQNLSRYVQPKKLPLRKALTNPALHKFRTY